MDVIEPILVGIIAIAVGVGVGYFVRKNISEAKIGDAEKRAAEIIDKAKRDSETEHKERLLEAKEEIHKLRTDAEKENKSRRNELQKFENRLVQRRSVR